MFKSIARFCVKEPIIILTILIISFAFGWYAQQNVPVDAIPNIGQNQVIVLTKWQGRSPKDVEDQITYPLSIALLSVPGAESVRGKSLFGFSFVQVTFKDEIDFYWARSRVSEQLGTVVAQLPSGVSPTLGPDATGLGQVLYYTLKPTPGMDLAKLRSIQDYVIKYALQSVEGVSEVASVGGFVRQYQVDIDPNKLRFHNIRLSQLNRAIRESNAEIGAKTVEQSGMEFIIRGKGFLGGGLGMTQTIEDIENAIVSSRQGIPIRVKDLGTVQNGTNFRRGAIDLNGAEAVGGVVVMRFGDNPKKVISAIKKKIKQLEPALHGVKIVPIYDRTTLIEETVATLTDALVHEILITIVVIILFLLHIRTSLIVAVTLPGAVLLSFMMMKIFNLDANIMSLAGIAIAIGNMVDMGIVVSENTYQHLANLYASKKGSSSVTASERVETIASAVAEVGPPLMTATATTVISFFPVFFLTGRDFKLFSPLAWTKTYALMSALIVSIILIPVLARFFLKPSTPGNTRKYGPLSGAILSAIAGYALWTNADTSILVQALVALSSAGIGYMLGYFMVREQLEPMEQNPVSRTILNGYSPILNWGLSNRRLALAGPCLVFLIGFGCWQGIAPFLWPLEKVISLTGYDLNDNDSYAGLKKQLSGLKSDDWIALDEGSLFFMPSLFPSASFSQAFTVLQTQDALIKEIPEVENVLGKIGRIDSALDPAPASMVETYITLKPKEMWREGMTQAKIWKEITKRAKIPGVTPASFLQPIEGRVIMLQSGIRASMAIRIFGADLQGLATAAKAVASQLKLLSPVNAATVNPDIVLGKPYGEFTVDRMAAARYGMTVKAINDVIQTAVGGKVVTSTIEGRERYPVRVRYLRELRQRVEDLESIPVVTPKGEVIPLGVLAKLTTTWGPAAISSEDARLVAHVSFSPSGEMGDIESVDAITKALTAAQERGELQLPAGYELQAVGSFQNQIEANQRLFILVPLVMLVNLFIIFLQFRKLGISILVFTGIPVAFGGGMILLSVLSIEINTAIWIGFIALFGISVDNGVILASYLESYFSTNPARTKQDIHEGVRFACLRRIRPCLMTTATTIVALIPVLISSGRGADVARAMALPIFGGMFTALLGLLIVPVVYATIKERELATAKVEPAY